jgi:hypothetical protein
MSFLMCLYVYYHGNNLHRFGFVRGALPTEEERNKGLSYGDILEHLSDADREFFQGSGFSSYESFETIDIKKSIEERGLVSRGDLHSEVHSDRAHVKNPLENMSPYERHIYNEMKQAELESRAFDKAHGLSRGYEMMNDDIDDDYGDIDLSIFDDLNM